MVRKKNQTGKKTKQTKLDQKLSPSMKKRYVLEHLGTMTYDTMAKNLKLSETRIYQILQEIRADRDHLQINKELIQTTAEEQYNRLNTQARLAFSNLMKEYQKVQAGGDDSKIWQYSSIYNQAERSLTQFLKAVGLYSPDLIINQSQTDNSITVIFAKGMEDDKKGKKKVKEVNSRNP